MLLQSIFGRDTAMKGIRQPVKGSRLLANGVGLSDSDSEAGQSDEAGADAEANDLLATMKGSDEEELGDDEQLEQASTHLITVCAVLNHTQSYTHFDCVIWLITLSVQWLMCCLGAASDHKKACHQRQNTMHKCSRSS